MRPLIIILSLSLTITSFSQDDARSYYSKAVELTDSGKLDEAIIFYNQAIDLNWLFHEAFFSRGYVYYLQGKYELAINDFDEAISIQPVKLYYYQKGLANEKFGKDYVAIQCFNEALKIDPDYMDAISQRGKLLDKNNKKEEALNDYKRLLELGINEPSLYYEIGWIYYSWNMQDSALLYMQKSLRFDKPSPMTYTTIGSIYESKNDHESAITTYNEAIKEFPDHDYFYYKRGINKLRDGSKTNDACKDFKKALKLGYKLAEVELTKHCKDY